MRILLEINEKGIRLFQTRPEKHFPIQKPKKINWNC